MKKKAVYSVDASEQIQLLLIANKTYLDSYIM